MAKHATLLPWDTVSTVSLTEDENITCVLSAVLLGARLTLLSLNGHCVHNMMCKGYIYTTGSR